ncbi:breast carcinoma AMPlified sequence, putative [Entamoeba invadens IP1]|uniref:Breast carcinoma AMPlified sequence, putative n=1 Tax=Entamoeba invadens IP1 TaxID=370355 RepID=L7FLG2_ENTIV|nr:breast carcinoma AMPlified sequence, putative [Entamoeba invadens IP1]ELP88552.1 breast carcinoma AMPlified sequence, putative [Entamoeba invadens IP1]|eukprot:XP_004255323.1 breast carcinoma AMPlified sequence, putative [Entamoeba invadens IP1]
MSHPQIAPFIKCYDDRQPPKLSTTIKGTSPTISVQSISFDYYPKEDGELRRCCIICEYHGIRVWDCENLESFTELFTYPVEDNAIPMYAAFSKHPPPILFFVTRNNQLVSVTFDTTGPVASSFFTNPYSQFVLNNSYLFALTPEGALHMYNINTLPPTYLASFQSTLYLINSRPLAVSSAYIAYPTYEAPLTYNVPPQSLGSIATEKLTTGVSWLTDNLQKAVYGTKSEKPDEEEAKKEFVIVGDFRAAPATKTIQRICHFCATTSRIRAMAFDHKGELLITCDDKGYLFNVYRINPSGGEDHLFVLNRGTTKGVITHIETSIDSSIVVISSTKTSHIFKIDMDVVNSRNKKISASGESEVRWLNIIKKISVDNEEGSICVCFDGTTLAQGINCRSVIYKMGKELSISGQVELNFPSESQYLNKSLFELATIIGEEDIYKNCESRVVTFDETKVKRLTKETNKFAIGKVAIAKQKALLEKTMSGWLNATTNVFDIDYTVKQDHEEIVSDCEDGEIKNDKKEEEKSEEEEENPYAVKIESGKDESKVDEHKEEEKIGSALEDGEENIVV